MLLGLQPKLMSVGVCPKCPKNCHSLSATRSLEDAAKGARDRFITRCNCSCRSGRCHQVIKTTLAPIPSGMQTLTPTTADLLFFCKTNMPNNCCSSCVNLQHAEFKYYAVYECHWFHPVAEIGGSVTKIQISFYVWCTPTQFLPSSLT